MDLVLHKKLLALQAENSMLKEELQKLKETSDELKQRYIKAATKDVFEKGQVSGRSFEHAVKARVKGDDHVANAANRAEERATGKARKRQAGIARAARLLTRDSDKPSEPKTQTIAQQRAENARLWAIAAGPEKIAQMRDAEKAAEAAAKKEMETTKNPHEKALLRAGFRRT